MLLTNNRSPESIRILDLGLGAASGGTGRERERVKGKVSVMTEIEGSVDPKLIVSD